MKNTTNSLMPLAALVLFGTCLVSVFSLLAVLMTSVGFAGGVPLFYYQRLNVAVISVALPIVGMILFTFSLDGCPIHSHMKIWSRTQRARRTAYRRSFVGAGSIRAAPSIAIGSKGEYGVCKVCGDPIAPKRLKTRNPSDCAVESECQPRPECLQGGFNFMNKDGGQAPETSSLLTTIDFAFARHCLGDVARHQYISHYLSRIVTRQRNPRTKAPPGAPAADLFIGDVNCFTAGGPRVEFRNRAGLSGKAHLAN
jgi:hypothetical protein